MESIWSQRLSRRVQYSGEALSKIDSSSANAIVLSSTTANRLRLQKGSDLFVYFLQKESNVPKIRKLKVVGLYHTGMEELDKHFAFCQLSLLQKHEIHAGFFLVFSGLTFR